MGARAGAHPTPSFEPAPEELLVMTTRTLGELSRLGEVA